MARIKPSGSHLLYYCAASLQMQEQFPEKEENQDSLDGTAAHWVGSECLISYLTKGQGVVGLKSPYDFVNSVAPNGVVINDEMCEAVDQYVISVLKVCNEFGLVQHLQVEKTIKIPKIHPTECEGTPDNYIWDGERRALHIWDFKYGHRVVEARNNTQMIEYCTGIIPAVTAGINMDNVTVHFHIVQPRSYHQDGTNRTWVATYPELDMMQTHLTSQSAIALTQTPLAQTNPDCGDCSGVAFCQTARCASTNAIDVASKMTTETIPTEYLKLHRSQLVRAARILKDRLTAIDAEIKALIKNGNSIDGLCLGYGKGRLVWSKPDEEIIALGEMMKIDLSKKGVITPTQAKAKKLNQDLIKSFSKNQVGKSKILDSNETRAANVFGTQTKR